MKLRPTILLAIAFISMMSYTSCVKKYICRCDIKYSGYPGLPPNNSKEFEIKDLKGTAKTTCEAESDSTVNNGIKSVETCYLY